MKNPAIPDIAAHTTIPATVGITNPSAAQRQPPASFFMVRSEVEQGKCINVKTITHSAVTHVQPFAVKSSAICAGASSDRLPCYIYAIIIKGITISLAGIPSRNAVTMTPSIPISLPKGSRKP